MTAAYEVRRGPVPGRAGVELVEVSLVAADTAVAVVLDGSDSCAALSSLVAKLPGLLARLPRRWPVWVYWLGDATAVGGFEGVTVGHVVDGSADVAAMAGDRTARAAAAVRGSFVGPVVAAIAARRADVVVLVVTDGRLTDFGPVDVPGGLRVVGVTTAGDAPAAWRQVLPGQPIYSPSEAGLDRWLAAHDAAAVGGRVVDVSAEGAMRLTADGQWQPVAGPIEWDAQTGPLRLLVAAGSPGEVVVGGTRLSLAGPTGGPSVEGLSAAGVTAGAAASGVLDVGRSDAEFDGVWAAAAAAVGCGERGESWRAGGATVAPLLAALGDAAAGLLLCRGDPRLAPPVDGRVVLIGLRRTREPSVDWAAGRATPVGVVTAALRVRHDRLEGRWVASRDGGDEIELNPRGGQRLADLPMVDGTSVVVTFSGEWA